jgi:hypothetical protein
LATWGSVPGVDFKQVQTNDEVAAGSYFRLNQTRKHLRTNFDPSVQEVLKSIYDGIDQTKEQPVYLSVTETADSISDPVWRTLQLDVITLHKSGTLVVDIIALIIIGAIVSYFLIQSLYFVATGKLIPAPGQTGQQTITNPKTGESVVVPFGYYFDANGNLVGPGPGIDLSPLIWIGAILGVAYVGSKFIGRKK